MSGGILAKRWQYMGKMVADQPGACLSQNIPQGGVQEFGEVHVVRVQGLGWP
jgi:hypothetical protein